MSFVVQLMLLLNVVRVNVMHLFVLEVSFLAKRNIATDFCKGFQKNLQTGNLSEKKLIKPESLFQHLPQLQVKWRYFL